jgi:hypothetical protein
MRFCEAGMVNATTTDVQHSFHLIPTYFLSPTLFPPRATSPRILNAFANTLDGLGARDRVVGRTVVGA